MKNIKPILESVYENEELRKSIVPLFRSNPGLGKSQIIKEFAKEKGASVVEIITSQILPYEVSGMSIPVKETGKMTYFDFDRIDNLKDGDILFFDELLNGNPVVINACLTLLESRVTVSGKKLPNIMIVAAANPQGAVLITPAIKERFVWYDVIFDASMWKKYMSSEYDMPNGISNQLCTLIAAEKFKDINFMTPRSIVKAVKCIIKSCPTPYSESIEPFLMKFVTNKLDITVDLGHGVELEPGDQIPWLSLVRLKHGIKHDVTIIKANPVDSEKDSPTQDKLFVCTFDVKVTSGNKGKIAKAVKTLINSSLARSLDLVEMEKFKLQQVLTDRECAIWTASLEGVGAIVKVTQVSRDEKVLPF
jgi:ribosomal protein L7/L12|tara:strand:- start:290 stop:1378 length:1089 start_codon:yes stop_codon:yes gene_type:complete